MTGDPNDVTVGREGVGDDVHDGAGVVGDLVEVGPASEFKFTDKRIRTFLRDGDPWFVAADVCEALGIINVSQATDRLDGDEVRICLVDTKRGPRRTLIVSESGLYVMTLRSDKPQATEFQRWVTRDVLPSIRRTGTYSMPNVQRNEGLGPVPGERFYHAGFGTFAASTSPGAVVGSLPAGHATVLLADFLEFSRLGWDVADGSARQPVHPSEESVIRYLGSRGLGDQCCRNPLNGKWLFRLDALQHWYRHVGSVMVLPPA